MIDDLSDFTVQVERATICVQSFLGSTPGRRVEEADWAQVARDASPGEMLHRLVFRDEIEQLWQQVMAVLRVEPEKRLVVRICFSEDSRDLASLPWESLRAPGKPFLASQFPLVRVFSQTCQGDRVFRALERVLLVGACPSGLPPIQSQEEHLSVLEQKLKASGLAVTVLSKATSDSLSEVLLSGTYEVLYFLGHGTLSYGPCAGPARGSLILEDPANEMGVALPASTLGLWLKSAQVSLLYLDACHSGAVGTESRMGVAGLPATAGLAGPERPAAASIAGGTLDIVVVPREPRSMPLGLDRLSAVRGDLPGGVAQAALAIGEVGAVIAHRREVRQKFALDTASRFIDWLRKGWPLEQAVHRVRAQVTDPYGDDEWSNLVAYTGYRRGSWFVVSEPPATAPAVSTPAASSASGRGAIVRKVLDSLVRREFIVVLAPGGGDLQSFSAEVLAAVEQELGTWRVLRATPSVLPAISEEQFFSGLGRDLGLRSPTPTAAVFESELFRYAQGSGTVSLLFLPGFERGNPERLIELSRILRTAHEARPPAQRNLVQLAVGGARLSDLRLGVDPKLSPLLGEIVYLPDLTRDETCRRLSDAGVADPRTHELAWRLSEGCPWLAGRVQELVTSRGIEGLADDAWLVELRATLAARQDLRDTLRKLADRSVSWQRVYANRRLHELYFLGFLCRAGEQLRWRGGLVGELIRAMVQEEDDL